jgi:hypothetical protein
VPSPPLVSGRSGAFFFEPWGQQGHIFRISTRSLPWCAGCWDLTSFKVRATARSTPLRLRLQACVCVAVHRPSSAVSLDLGAVWWLHLLLLASTFIQHPWGLCDSKAAACAVRCAPRVVSVPGGVRRGRRLSDRDCDHCGAEPSPWTYFTSRFQRACSGASCVSGVCLSSSRGSIMCDVDPSAWCALGVNNPIHSLFINV